MSFLISDCKCVKIYELYKMRKTFFYLDTNMAFPVIFSPNKPLKKGPWCLMNQNIPLSTVYTFRLCLLIFQNKVNLDDPDFKHHHADATGRDLMLY